MASNQSWTSWILDSYASSVHPSAQSPDTETSDPLEVTQSTAPLSGSRSPSSSSSPFGPFVKTGRGGAGNFIWQADEPREDVEAQRQSSLTERQKAAAQIEHLETGEALSVSKLRKRRSSQFLKTGIGGAGSLALVQSNEIQSPRSPSFTRSPISGTFPKLSHGRGGAGNYAAAMDAEKKIETEREYEERIVAERTREKIEQDVESLLRPPQGALLSEGRRKEGVV